MSPANLAHVVSRGRWIPVPHLIALNDKLMQLPSGQMRRLIVTMPPRHGKSELVSHYLPAWFLNNWPEKRIILASYEADFAATWGRKVRNTIVNNERVLSVRIADDSSAANRWDTTVGGGMVTAGVGGPITGRGAHCLLVDDPVKNAEEANSVTYRQRAWDWWTSTAYTRLEPGGVVVVVMTRWHKDDLTGRLLEEMDSGGEQWEVINLPALAEFGDVLGRQEGAALWPERYPVNELMRIRQAVGTYVWQALYQQRPISQEGAIWKREYWRAYREAPRFELIVQAWDTAFQKSETADYSACTTWGVNRAGFYLLDVRRGRLEFPVLVDAVRLAYERWAPNWIIVEDHASGQSLLQVLRQDTRLPIIGRKMETSKEIRAWAVVGLAEAGRLYLPEQAPWLGEYLAEMEEFPHGKHDDQVDSTTLALNYLRPFAGEHLSPASDVDYDTELPAEMGFGNEYERASLDLGRGSDLAPWSGSRWSKVRKGFRK